ncbi:5'-3' exoribonuclease 2 [Babesia caballi]|uniref:5'-3' exoribonuclease 2 n=1 Tax=Babesia caballi TaxID=5871 RepID=A0AAV4LW53_BABCB|nr:5'-3' exoribonuclease 2 [Babesia caballi]
MSHWRGSDAMNLALRTVGLRRQNRCCYNTGYRRFSFLRSLFEAEQPLDKTPAPVSLFDKESVLHDFQASLNALASRNDASFTEYVSFLREAEYPPEDGLPSLSGHDTATLLLLADALTFISHSRLSAPQVAMLDKVAAELALRPFLQEATLDSTMLMHCAACLSRVRHASEAVKTLGVHLNKEVRSNCTQLLRRGQFVETLCAMAHIAHPSLVDMIVHTCCVRSNDLLAVDLARMPKLLSKFKIDDERVLLPLLERVANDPVKAFNSEPRLCRQFLAGIAAMGHMCDGEGIFTDKAVSKLLSLLTSGLERYSTDDVVFLISGMPSVDRLSRVGDEGCRELLRHLLMRIGVVTGDDTGAAAEKNAGSLQLLTTSQLIAVVGTVTRLDPFQGEIEAEADVMVSMVLGEKVGSLPAPTGKLTRLFDSLATEICNRADKCTSLQPHGETRGLQTTGLLNMDDVIPIIRLADRLFMASQSHQAVRERLFSVLQTAMASDLEKSDESVYAVIRNTLKCHSSTQRRLIKPVFHVLRRTAGKGKVGVNSHVNALKLLQALAQNECTASNNDDGNLFASVDANFVNESASQAIATVDNSLMEGSIEVGTCLDAISQLYLTMVRLANGGVADSNSADIMGRLRKRLLEAMSDTKCNMPQATVRNIAKLPDGDELGDHLDASIAAWAKVEDKQDSLTPPLDNALTYFVARCDAKLGELEGSGDDLDRLSGVADVLQRQLFEFGQTVDTHFGRKNYAHQGGHAADQHAWEASVGLRTLFKPPEEPRDVFLADNMRSVSKHFPVAQYRGIHHEATGIMSLFQLRRHLQECLTQLTQLELRLARLVRAEKGDATHTFKRLRESVAATVIAGRRIQRTGAADRNTQRTARLVQGIRQGILARGSAAEKDDAFRLLESLERGAGDAQAAGIPDGFDNLYLDVNGIIHNCSHSIEELCQSIRSEEDIFVLIFQYINNLVKIVRPRQLLYLAIDGVAPRAKIIQQRERRFRSAQDSKKNDVVFKTLVEEQKADAVAPDTSGGNKDFKFDPIQITPGTPFMERLTVRLQFFAHMMIHEHQAWKHLKIVVSGSDVPGEGEHKIMEYIRNNKARRYEEAQQGKAPVYVSHCIYGLDADLIMLSLATHEPYVCLLREQIYFFSKQTQTRMMMNMNDYVFMHIGVLRDYILHDLILVEELRRRPSSIDRVVDDFVLVTMFMGNDFLPHGKFAKIVDGGLNAYLSMYARYVEGCFKTAPRSDFWLVTGCGEINYYNLVRYLGMLVKRESSRITDELYCGADASKRADGRKPRKDAEITVIDVENTCIAKDPHEFRKKYAGPPKTVAEWRSRYYLAKMGIASDVILHNAQGGVEDPDAPRRTVPEVVRDYLEGIQWVMYYYYRGVPSWSWYLRCKYAPLLMDVQMFLKKERQRAGKTQVSAQLLSPSVTLAQVMQIAFDLAEPCTPFEQLMMVLPPAAAYMLPGVFASLMTDEDSPLRRFYPETFDIDMDDTHVQWGGITLLPVVPFLALQSYMNGALLSTGKNRFTAYPGGEGRLCYMESTKLTEDEKYRNNVGIARLYFFNPESAGKTVESPLETFKTIVRCMVDYRPFFNPTLRKGQTFPAELMMGLQKNACRVAADRGSNVWFPSLSMLPFTPFARVGVQVFQTRSHLPSVYLWIKQPLHRVAMRNLMKGARSTYVKVGYPYQHVGRLEAILTPYVTVREGKISVGNPQELALLLADIRQSLAKKGVIVSHRSPEPSLPSDPAASQKSSQALLKLLEALPGCAVSPNLPSVRQARAAGLDHVCENVVVRYRVLDINLQDTTQVCHSMLTFVHFVGKVDGNVPQLRREVFRGSAAAPSDVGISNNLNEMIALCDAIRQHEILYGKFSKPLIKAVCVMQGSLYGSVGAIDTVGNTFQEISAVFPVPDYRITIAENAMQLYERHVKLRRIVAEREAPKWYSFEEICCISSLPTTTATAVFHLLTHGQYHDDIGMHLALWSEEHGCVMCLPGYTRCPDALLTSEEMSRPDALLRGVEYSDAVVELVRRYRESFPELFLYFEQTNIRPNNGAKGGYRYHISLDQVFHENPQVSELRKDQLSSYVSAAVFRRQKLTVGNYQCLSPQEIDCISYVYDEGAPALADGGVASKLVRVSHMENLHIPAYNTGTVFLREQEVRLGECVLYINHKETVPLGTRGTVVGIYPQNADGSGRLFEVVLERGFVGASDLFGRCGKMRGIFVTISDILPLYHDAVEDLDAWSAVNQAHDRNNASNVSYV